MLFTWNIPWTDRDLSTNIDIPIMPTTTIGHYWFCCGLYDKMLRITDCCDLMDWWLGGLMAAGSRHSAGGTYTLCWDWALTECRDAEALWCENTRGEERDWSRLRISSISASAVPGLGLLCSINASFFLSDATNGELGLHPGLVHWYWV